MNIFQLKNGKRFMTALMNCDGKKPEICIMFADNVRNHPCRTSSMTRPIKESLNMGTFQMVVIDAFKWIDTPEGPDFWKEIYNTIRDCDMIKPRKVYPDYRKKDRFCMVCDIQLSEGWKYCKEHAAEVLTKTNKHRSAKKAAEVVREAYIKSNAISE